MLTLTLFGTPMLDGPDGPVTARGTRGRRLALLALLALNRGRPVTRDRVVALLWPEASPQRARAQLSDALYLLRRTLGDDAIQATGDDLLLNPLIVTSDVAEFDRLTAEGDLDAAVALIAGPLLDGFHLSDAIEFEYWLSRQRSEFRDRHSAALESLAQASGEAHQFVDAVRWWRRLAALDPGMGRVALRLMQALDNAGDRGGALRFAREHAELLRQEFETEPDPDVVAYEEELRRAPRGRSLPIPPMPLPAAASPAPSPAPAAVNRPAHRRLSIGWGFAALALVALGLWWFGAWPARPSALRSIAEPSVAVLPFANLSADSAHAYFSDGLSELVIVALSRVEHLRVAARNSSFAFRDGALDLRSIGDTLGVQSILQGSVLRDGGRLRVTARLSDAVTGDQLWSAEYDRDQADVLAVQEEIARAIAGALELRLGGRGSVGALDGAGLEAYDRYLRGLYLRNSLSGEGLRQAAAHFDRAIALDPLFALAYAGKASVIAPLIYFGELPRDRGVAEVRRLTARALELDPRLGEAYAALGILKLFFEWDWEAARQALARAIELNPNDAHAHHHMANYLSAMGRGAEGLVERERSISLDPLNARTRYVVAGEYARMGEPGRALAEYRRAFQLDPVNPLGLGLGPGLPATAGWVHLRAGRTDEAVEDFLRVAMLRNADPQELDEMRRAYAVHGMPGFWRAWMAMDVRQSGSAPNSLRSAALGALVGDTAKAIDGLERAYAERNPGLIYVRAAFADLQDHPRVKEIVRRMRFPEP